MRTLLYLIALVFGTVWHGSICIVAALLRVPRVPGGVYDRANRRWARLALRGAGVSVAVEGADTIRAEEPRIVAANHSSWFDILALLAALPVTVKFVSKREIFRIPLLGQAMRATGHVSLDRANPKEAFAIYATAARQIVAGRLSVLVFPEGTRTRTGELQPFKIGLFVLAIESGAPIVPVHISGTFGIQPKGSIRIRPHPVRITVGAPIPTAGLTTEGRDALKDRVRAAMVALAAKSVDAARAAG